MAMYLEAFWYTMWRRGLINSLCLMMILYKGRGLSYLQEIPDSYTPTINKVTGGLVLPKYNVYINYYHKTLISALSLLTFLLLIMTILAVTFSWLCLTLTFPNQCQLKLQR